jgi:hypothetical protein
MRIFARWTVSCATQVAQAVGGVVHHYGVVQNDAMARANSLATEARLPSASPPSVPSLAHFLPSASPPARRRPCVAHSGRQQHSDGPVVRRIEARVGRVLPVPCVRCQPVRALLQAPARCAHISAPGLAKRAAGLEQKQRRAAADAAFSALPVARQADGLLPVGDQGTPPPPSCGPTYPSAPLAPWSGHTAATASEYLPQQLASAAGRYAHGCVVWPIFNVAMSQC